MTRMDLIGGPVVIQLHQLTTAASRPAPYDCKATARRMVYPRLAGGHDRGIIRQSGLAQFDLYQFVLN